MKIACVASSRVPSTTANSIQVMKVCQALSQIGNEVRLWLPGNSPAGWDELQNLYGLTNRFEISWLRDRPFYRRYDLAFTAVMAAEKWQADLIYTWLPQAAWLGLQRSNIVVLEVHDRPTGKAGPWLLRKTAGSRGKKRLAVITRALEHALAKEFNIHIHPKDLVIAPNGVDLERYENLPTPAQARQQLGLPQKPTAVYSGHFYPGRGMDLLLDLARAFPQVQFLWVGGQPPAVQQWRKKIIEDGLENIQLTGFVENQKLPLYQAAAEFLFMPYETSVAGSSGGNSADICSPMKMFEYLACGRVIISSDLPVLSEILNQQNAVFCPPQDSGSWQQALQSLLDNPGRVVSLSERAKRDARAYTWRARAEKTLQGLV